MKSTRDILEAMKSGDLSVEEAEEALRTLSLTAVGQIGMIDLNREERNGIPEVVLAETKSIKNLIQIVQKIVSRKEFALLTRVQQAKLETLQQEMNEYHFDVSGDDDHLTVLVHDKKWSEPQKQGKIAIITAGTSDVVYAEEAVAIARIMGVESLTLYDIGVAGIHRIIEPVMRIIEEKVDAVVVFAGMEGALPTVLASLVDIPVIGVPVPVGYGYGGAGETALASMLQSCAPGLAVVNIGNGLGGGSVACLIARNAAKKRD
ncbi:MAG: nickel pincer cofactor biosynthesis protein LarB [Candidatus Thorarchaeota archaeon]|nr:nickel pincer cofactor biosynthesis protein LarB [Candidatus Thorarchaeota archaeon]